MFFFFSKLLRFLYTPIFLGILPLILSYLPWFSATWKKRLRLSSLILILFFSNQFVANELMLAWEPKPIAMSAINPGEYEVGIILTGLLNTRKSPHDRVYFDRGTDRLMHALRLYKEGKIGKLLITGGAMDLAQEEIKEADQLKEILLMLDVPEEDILIDNKAVNTRENAVNAKALMEVEFPGKKAIIFTSAYHMPRAKACFEKVGMTDALYFPTEYLSEDRNLRLEYFIYPAEGSLTRWSVVFKEWVGLLVYKILGYA